MPNSFLAFLLHHRQLAPILQRQKHIADFLPFLSSKLNTTCGREGNINGFLPALRRPNSFTNALLGSIFIFTLSLAVCPPN